MGSLRLFDLVAEDVNVGEGICRYLKGSRLSTVLTPSAPVPSVPVCLGAVCVMNSVDVVVEVVLTVVHGSVIEV